MIGVDALKWIKAQGGIHTIELDGRTYALESINRIKDPSESAPGKLIFHTLDGLLDYAATQFKSEVVAGVGYPAFHVKGPDRVKLYAPMQTAIGNVRWCYAEAELIEDNYEYGEWYTQEQFIIELMGKFVHDNNLLALVSMVASITSVQESKTDDDGISPMIEIRKGLRLREEKKIENPITLAPWRTFREIDQPSSQFVIRISEDRQNRVTLALYEADGAVWKMEAIGSIGNYLSDRMTGDQWPDGYQILVFS